jgi:putative heme transporter
MSAAARGWMLGPSRTCSLGVVVMTSSPEQGSATARRGPPPRVRQVAKAVLSLLLVAGITYFLWTRIDFAEVWAEIRAMTRLELAILVAIAAWNVLTYAFVWMTVTPGLSFGRAMTMTQSTTAVSNTVPGGSAIGIGMTYSMLGSWGHSRSRATTAVLVSGVWNSFIKLGLPVLALGAVALTGSASSGRVVAALAGLGGLAVAVVVFGAGRSRPSGSAPAPWTCSSTAGCRSR